MRLEDVLNYERVKALGVDSNAYINPFGIKQQNRDVNSQSAQKVVFSQPYENANRYYNMHEFSSPQPPQSVNENKAPNNIGNTMPSMFDIKSLLPMLMSGKFTDILKPLMSMFAGGGVNGGMDIAKIFELFKPKSKQKKSSKEVNDVSKFDDFVVIED
jgi:hypothetical protein